MRTLRVRLVVTQELSNCTSWHHWNAHNNSLDVRVGTGTPTMGDAATNRRIAISTALGLYNSIYPPVELCNPPRRAVQ